MTEWEPCAFCAGRGVLTGADGTDASCPRCLGDRGRHERKPEAWRVRGPFVVGEVSVTVTEQGTGVFSKWRRNVAKESYMMVETGTGHGQVYYPDHLFATEHEAQDVADERTETGWIGDLPAVAVDDDDDEDDL